MLFDEPGSSGDVSCKSQPRGADTVNIRIHTLQENTEKMIRRFVLIWRGPAAAISNIPSAPHTLKQTSPCHPGARDMLSEVANLLASTVLSKISSFIRKREELN